MAAYQAPPSLGFSRQEHWSGEPLPSPVHESERWKWSLSVATPWTAAYQAPPSMDFPGKRTGVGCHCLLRKRSLVFPILVLFLYFFALITEEGFLISPCYSLGLCIQMGISFLFSFSPDYTVEVTNRFKGLYMIDRVPKNYVWRFMTLYRRQVSRPSPRKRNANKQNGCLRRPYI